MTGDRKIVWTVRVVHEGFISLSDWAEAALENLKSRLDSVKELSDAVKEVRL